MFLLADVIFKQDGRAGCVTDFMLRWGYLICFRASIMQCDLRSFFDMHDPWQVFNVRGCVVFKQ